MMRAMTSDSSPPTPSRPAASTPSAEDKAKASRRFNIGCGAFVAFVVVLLVIAFALPNREEDSPASSSFSGSSASSARKVCGADTDADLDTYARNASAELAKRGRTIAASTIRGQVLDSAKGRREGPTASCLDLFALYVVTESP